MTRKSIRGIVVDKVGRDVILLTRGGEFIRMPADRSYLIGMEAEIDPPLQKGFPLLFSAAIAAALMIFAAFYSIQPVLTAPHAYLAVDINPSIVFSLDRNAVVLEAIPLNVDGESILETLNAEGSNAFEVLENLLWISHANRYLSAGKDNIIIISLAAPKGFGITEKELRFSVSEQLLQMELDTYLKIAVTGLDKVEKAKDISVPLNALLLAEEMKKMMKEDQSHSLLEGAPPLSIKEFLQTINPVNLFAQDELVVGKGQKDSTENLPESKDDEPVGDNDGDDKPIGIPTPVLPEPAVPTDPKDCGTPAP